MKDPKPTVRGFRPLKALAVSAGSEGTLRHRAALMREEGWAKPTWSSGTKSDCMRPAAKPVQAADKHDSDLTVKTLTSDGQAVNGKNFFKVLTLGVVRDLEIQVRGRGADG